MGPPLHDEPHVRNQIVRALGLLILTQEHLAGARCAGEVGVAPPETRGWLRMAQREVERALDVYQEAAVLVLRDSKQHWERLRTCARFLGYAREYVVGAALPICARPEEPGSQLWKWVTELDALLETCMSHITQMAAAAETVLYWWGDRA